MRSRSDVLPKQIFVFKDSFYFFPGNIHAFCRFKHYFDWQESNTLVVVQIEHITAVENLESILSVDGVDAYIVGPYDLSGSLGIPGKFNAPEFIDAMQQNLMP